MVRFDVVWKAYEQTWELVRANFKTLFWALAKINAISIAVFLFALGIAVGAVVLMLGASATHLIQSGGWASAIAVIALAIGIVLVGDFISEVFVSVAYNIVDNRTHKKETDVLATASRNLVPMLKYTLFGLVVFIPLMAIYFYSLLQDHPVFSEMGEILLNGFGLVFGFVFQFAMWELLVARRGLWESLGSSFRLVKNNLVEAIAFSIAYSAVSLVVFIPVVALILVLTIGGAFAFVPLLALENTAVLALAAVLAILVLVAIMVVWTAVQQTLLVTAQYFFWKQLKGTPAMVSTPSRSRKPRMRK